MKHFATSLFAIAVLLSGQNAVAAGCKYQVNSTDKFTQVLTQWTKWNALMHGFSQSLRDHSPFISVYSVDGEAELQLKIESFTQQMKEPGLIELDDYIYVLEGAPLLVMMADGTVTKLLAKNEVRNDAYVVAPEDNTSVDTNLYWIKATTVIKYALDADIKKALASQPATKIRLTMANSNLDFEIHKKSLDDFKLAVQCIS